MFDRSAVEALSAYKHEPAWMTKLRLDAWDAYAASPLAEEIALAMRDIRPFQAAPARPVPSREWPRDLQHALDERGDEEGLIVQRDSTVLSRSITKEHSKKGVVFLDMDTALQTIPEKVRPYFGRLIKPENPYAALHAAFWSGGTFLYVPDHLDIHLPFHTCVWMSTPQVGVFPHTLVVVEEGSSVSFIDESISANWDSPALTVEAVEAFVGRGALMNFFYMDNLGKSVRNHRIEKSEVVSPGRLISGRLEQRPVTTLERAAELYPEVRV